MNEIALAPTRVRKQRIKQTAKTTWTIEEDELLSKLVSQSPQENSWSVISKYFPNKTPPQIAGRWEKVLNPSLVKGSWTREEDQIILNFVQTNGDKDWAKLALLLNGRTGKQCRERFKNHLDPNLLKNPWTPEEDQKLIDLHSKFGNQWTRISSFFVGRTDNSIKNRWNSTLKKRLERLEKGEPLMQKRGRKPKDYYANLPKPQLEEQISDAHFSPVEACSSPVLPKAQSSIKVVQMVALTLDHLEMIKPKKDDHLRASSLEENRIGLRKLLNSLE